MARAKIVLLAAEGTSNKEIARRPYTSPQTVSKWRKRFHEEGLGGLVLRLCLPDLDLAIAAYQSGRQEYFLVWSWDTISGNFITQIVDHGYNYTPFTYEFSEELLWKAGFADVHRVGHHHTVSSYPEIVELERRESGRSFYVEAFK